MSDPFHSLGGSRPAVDPEPEFVATVMRAVQERLSSPSETVVIGGDTDPIDLEVVSMDAHHEGRKWWLVAAAIVVVLASLTAVAVFRDDSSSAPPATQPPTTNAPAPAEPLDVQSITSEYLPVATYFVDPDRDSSTPLRVIYDVAAAGWQQWSGAYKGLADGSQVAVTITTVTNVAKDGCLDHQPADPPVGPTVDDLATALSDLAPFEVTSPAADVTMYGYQGKFLQWIVPEDLENGASGFVGCSDGELRSWIAPFLGGPFWGYNGQPGYVEEFWILDVGGTRLVIEAQRSPNASEQDIAEMRAVLDSIQIEP